MSILKHLQNKLNQRKDEGSLRALKITIPGSVDFTSNDYLGLSKSKLLAANIEQSLFNKKLNQINGSSGSRLLGGNTNATIDLEDDLAKIHLSDAALLFNSGYDANLGLISAVTQRNTVILYDEFIHASLRDGIRLSGAKAFKFKHNDLTDLEEKLIKHHASQILIITETVFSMDGDSPDLKQLFQLTQKHNSEIILDEAHAIAISGPSGLGLSQEFAQHPQLLARVYTYGKGPGVHGAAVIGSTLLKNYLINFCRPFIYSTALPPHSAIAIKESYALFKKMDAERKQLKQLVHFLDELTTQKNITLFGKNNPHSCIRALLIPGNENVKKTASIIQEKGFDVRPVLSPTIPEGSERLRLCIHTYNTEKEITDLIELIKS